MGISCWIKKLRKGAKTGQKPRQKQYIDKVKVISQLAWNVHSQNVKSIFLAIAQCSIFAISLRIIIEILSFILGILHQEINRFEWELNCWNRTLCIIGKCSQFLSHKWIMTDDKQQKAWKLQSSTSKYLMRRTDKKNF